VIAGIISGYVSLIRGDLKMLVIILNDKNDIIFKVV
jgi:hypothetical protein